MGAYGGTKEESKAPYVWVLLGDLNNDGTVNFKDYAAQQAWQIPDINEQPWDLDRNKVWNLADLALLVNDWLKVREYTEPEESYTPKVWDPNDGSDSHSNNIPTPMLLHQDNSLKEPKDLVEITKSLARKQADKVIKQVLEKPVMRYS